MSVPASDLFFPTKYNTLVQIVGTYIAVYTPYTYIGNKVIQQFLFLYSTYFNQFVILSKFYTQIG